MTLCIICIICIINKSIVVLIAMKHLCTFIISLCGVQATSAQTCLSIGHGPTLFDFNPDGSFLITDSIAFCFPEDTFFCLENGEIPIEGITATIYDDNEEVPVHLTPYVEWTVIPPSVLLTFGMEIQSLDDPPQDLGTYEFNFHWPVELGPQTGDCMSPHTVPFDTVSICSRRRHFPTEDGGSVTHGGFIEIDECDFTILDIEPTCVWGDLDGDGVYTLDEENLIRGYILGIYDLEYFTPEERLIVDISCDGTVSTYDLALLNYWHNPRGIEDFPPHTDPENPFYDWTPLCECPQEAYESILNNLDDDPPALSNSESSKIPDHSLESTSGKKASEVLKRNY